MSNEVKRYTIDEAGWHLTDGQLLVRAEDYDALAAELAAIRAAGGEQVEVVAYLTSAVKPGPKLSVVFSKEDAESQHANWLHQSESINTEPLMTVAQHQRIVAAMAAELVTERGNGSYWKEQYENLRNDYQRTINEKAALVTELEAARKQEPDSDADLATRMKAAGMMSVAELLAGAPLDAFTRHAAVKDLQSLLRWAEMRRAECLKAQARYDLGERDKSDDLYEWTVAHCAVFTELHVNIRAALAGLPPLAGQVSVPRELLDRIAAPFEPGSRFGDHVNAVAQLRALLATPSMEVKS